MSKQIRSTLSPAREALIRQDLMDAIHLGMRNGAGSDPLAPWAIWWEHKDGSEGGNIDLGLLAGKITVLDYDGAFSLPDHIASRLRYMGVVV